MGWLTKSLNMIIARKKRQKLPIEQAIQVKNRQFEGCA
jgi:hypothetical protein